jgi:diguanylate cyclase (GGDEF)-like protein/PAS domain S-box-containing protein
MKAIQASALLMGRNREYKRTVSQLRAVKDSLQEEKNYVQVTLNAIQDAVLQTDLSGNITFLNQAAERLTGWQLKESLGKSVTEVFFVVDEVTGESAINPAKRAIEEKKAVTLGANAVLWRRDGSKVAIEDSASPLCGKGGEVIGAVIVFHDVSESRAMVQKMAYLAQHDFLTGLPNRLLLVERLCRAIGLAQRNNKLVGLLFIDLDYFKQVNDALGHAVGDQLLKSVSERLRACVRNTDSVCRQGGDEFVILLTEIERHADAVFMAEKILATFIAPHPIGIHELHVTLSIGISIYPDDGDAVEPLLQCADAAMYHAKALGRNNFQFYKTKMNQLAIQRAATATSLRRALKNNEFTLYYQPKIDLNSGAIIGAEALLRWRDPERGLVFPNEFIAIAEECGLIIPIGQWVLGEACRQIKAWLNLGLNAVPVAINISTVELKHTHFLASITSALESTGAPSNYLEMELTESILLHDPELAIKVLSSLKKKGIHLAIDDFGTGYSSLSYLKRLPIDTLKIDQSFVRDITRDTDSATIVNAVIGLGHNLNQRVIAEGIETLEQLALLRTQNCHEGQGFHFSEALPANEFAQLLENQPAFIMF